MTYVNTIWLFEEGLPSWDYVADVDGGSGCTPEFTGSTRRHDHDSSNA